MKIDKSDRTQLRGYFRTNSIPTQSNFEELINGMLNQKDDGIVKLPNNPLSIQASGDSASPQKVIDFYKDFKDPDPAWTLNLNPRSKPSDSNTAKSGFSISDGQGNSRLFIDATTGNVGIGTTAPGTKLHVTGNGSVLNLEGTNHAYIQWLPQTLGKRRKAWIGFGSSGSEEFYITSEGGSQMVHISNGLLVEGNVGIGTTNPKSSLEIRKDKAGLLGPILTLSNNLGGSGAGAGIDFNGYDVGNNDPTARIRSIDDGKSSSHIVFYTKKPDSQTNNLEERFRINSDGNVGIATNNPTEKLHVDGKVKSKGNLTDSDLRAKKDIEELHYGLEELKKLRPVMFNWKTIPNPHKNLGLIAQEVQPVIQEVVYMDDSAGGDNSLSIAYTNLIPVLINAIKQLDSKISNIAARSP